MAGRRREISDYNRAHTGSGELTPVLRLGAGACAGIVAMSATYPLDMVRGRLTVQDGLNQQYRGIWHATRTILAQVREAQMLARSQTMVLMVHLLCTPRKD